MRNGRLYSPPTQSPENFPFGRWAPDHTLPAIKNGSNTFQGSNDASAAKHVELLVIPPGANSLEPFEEWLILGNDKYGDCNAVLWANERRLVSPKLGPKEL